MTIEELKTRIAKKEQEIAKTEKLLNKYLSEESAEYKAIIERYLATGDSTEHHNYLKAQGRCYGGDVWSKAITLYDARNTLVKYQNMLNLEVAKENEFENNRILVIWNFLLNYKEQVAQYIRNNIKVLNEYYEVNSKMCDWHNNNAYKVRHGEMTKEEFDRVYNELHKKEKELKSDIHPYTEMVAKYNGYRQPHTVDEAKLEEILLRDCKARYFQLVNEVTKITGIIIDATNLSITAGELNGIIIGEKGKAKVQTFSAGGWNIQCFHYRTRVDEVRA